MIKTSKCHNMAICVYMCRPEHGVSVCIKAGPAPCKKLMLYPLSGWTASVVITAAEKLVWCSVASIFSPPCPPHF